MDYSFSQPDLFLVMNEEEMDAALTFAEEVIGNKEKSVEMYMNFSIDNPIGQYQLSINTIDVRNHLLDENSNYKFEFPMIPYYCLIFFENEGKKDCIALAIPISVWPEAYDIEYVKSFFKKHNFKVIDCIHKLFLEDALANTIIPEYKQAQIKQIDSPWTIRDKDTLAEALVPGGESSAISDGNIIDYILFLQNANITLDFQATAIVSSRFDTTKIDCSTFYFPNALIIYTKDGKKTPIYIGSDVRIHDILEILKENGLFPFTTSKDLSDFLENIDEVITELMPFARVINNTDKKYLHYHA